MPRAVITITHRTAYTYREMLAAEGGGVITSGAVQRAREWLAEGAVDVDFWYEHVIDLWTEALAQVGFPGAKISFDGFYHQGQGASFQSDDDGETLLGFLATPLEPSETIFALPGGKEDFRAWVVSKVGGVRFDRRFARLLPIRDYLSISMTHRYGYRSEVDASASRVSVGIDCGNHETPRLAALVERFQDAAEELRHDLCHAIFTSLRDEYEYCQSDESLLDMADANEYEFDRHGNRI